MSQMQSSTSRPHLVVTQDRRTRRPAPPGLRGRSVKLVVCDGHRLFLEALTSAIAREGYVVEAAVTSPADALQAVALHRPDVLLIESGFPEGSGLDLVRQVVAHHPRTRVVMVSGDDSPRLLSEALQAGVTGYALKSDGIQEILRTAERAHRGETCFDRGLLRRARDATTQLSRGRRPLDDLTPQELRVLSMLAQGLATKQMVKELGVSHSTVRTHVQNILAKLGVHSRLQAVALLTDDVRPAFVEQTRAAAK